MLTVHKLPHVVAPVAERACLHKHGAEHCSLQASVPCNLRGVINSVSTECRCIVFPLRCCQAGLQGTQCLTLRALMMMVSARQKKQLVLAHCTDTQHNLNLQWIHMAVTLSDIVSSLTVQINTNLTCCRDNTQVMQELPDCRCCESIKCSLWGQPIIKLSQQQQWPQPASSNA